MDVFFRTLQGGRRTVVTVGGLLTGVAIRGRKDPPDLLLGIAVAIFKARPRTFDSYTLQLIESERSPVHRATISDNGTALLIQLWHQYHMEFAAQDQSANDAVARLLSATARLSKIGESDCACQHCVEDARSEARDAMAFVNAPKPAMTLSEKYARQWLKAVPIVALDSQTDVEFWKARMGLLLGGSRDSGILGKVVRGGQPDILIVDDPLAHTGIAGKGQPAAPLTIEPEATATAPIIKAKESPIRKALRMARDILERPIVVPYATAMPDILAMKELVIAISAAEAELDKGEEGGRLGEVDLPKDLPDYYGAGQEKG